MMQNVTPVDHGKGTRRTGQPGPARILANVAWVSACAFLCVLAVGVQIDRSARKDSTAAEWTPQVFKGYALETQARDALANGNNDQGLALARELVLRRPVPAESLALYTNALLATGKGEAAAPALTLAAQRGWRDRYVQRLMVLVAAQGEDWPTAAQRLIALWRQEDRGEETLALSKAVLVQPEALKEFLDQFGALDKWNPVFLAWAADNLSVQSVRLAASTAGKRGAPLDCRVLARGAYGVAAHGRAQAAAAMWDAACASRSGGARTQSAFIDVSDNDKGPLDWRYPDNADLTTELVSDERGVSLRYTNSAPVRVIVAERFAFLSQGAHRASVEATGQAGRLRSLLLRVSCFSPDHPVISVGVFNLDGQGAQFTVPADCPTQRLEISAARGEGSLYGVRIE